MNTEKLTPAQDAESPIPEEALKELRAEWALIWKQAMLLGIREELAEAWFSLLENHAERVQRVKARHVGGGM